MIEILSKHRARDVTPLKSTACRHGHPASFVRHALMRCRPHQDGVSIMVDIKVLEHYIPYTDRYVIGI
jgi:hypothetical protein